MKLGMDASSRPGWLLADEGPDEFASMAFTIPYPTNLEAFTQIELSMAGERDGAFEEFTLVFIAGVFVEPTTQVRFALHDPLAPTDFRGLPFPHTFPYIGNNIATLLQYGVAAPYSFLPLSPLDLNTMDRLYLEQRIIFAGTTTTFGLHAQPAQKMSSPVAAASSTSVRESGTGGAGEAVKTLSVSVRPSEVPVEGVHLVLLKDEDGNLFIRKFDAGPSLESANSELAKQ
jgi:hypothetical protein